MSFLWLGGEFDASRFLDFKDAKRLAFFLSVDPCLLLCLGEGLFEFERNIPPCPLDFFFGELGITVSVLIASLLFERGGDSLFGDVVGGERVCDEGVGVGECEGDGVEVWKCSSLSVGEGLGVRVGECCCESKPESRF